MGRPLRSRVYPRSARRCFEEKPQGGLAAGVTRRQREPVKQPTLRRPCSLRRRVRRRPISSLANRGRGSRPPQTGGAGESPPAKNARGWRAGKARQNNASSLLGTMRRLSARHRSVVTATGRASGNHATEAWPAISQLLAGDHSVPRRSPVAARELGRSVRLPPAGAASLLRFMTPHEAPSVEQDKRILIRKEPEGQQSYRNIFIPAVSVCCAAIFITRLAEEG
jgi:hypothetical protein